MPERHEPWKLESANARILIALSGCMVIAVHAWWIHATQGAAPRNTATLVGRMLEIQAAAPHLVPVDAKALSPLLSTSLSSAAPGTKQPWDRAVLAVLAADAGLNELADSLRQDAALPESAAADAFHACFNAAFDDAALPTATQRAEAATALGDSLAAQLLDARLAGREGGDAAALRTAAYSAMKPRLVTLGVLAALMALAGLAGLGFTTWLLKTTAPLPEAQARFAMSGTALLAVFVGWGLAFLVGSVATRLLAQALPGMRAFLIPLGYTFHASIGLTLACRAEGVGLAELWRRLTPGPRGRAALFGLGFYTTTLVSLFVVALVMRFALERNEPLQPELLELISSVRGFGANAVLLGSIALLAPAFEEFMFRGVLLHWLEERTGTRFAVVASALLFALVHAAPAATPALFVLGLMLSLAVLRTRSLVSSMVVHALWNGASFMMVRTLA